MDAKMYQDCDLKCPPSLAGVRCCRNCAHSRKEFYEAAPDDVKALWKPGVGFWDKASGCMLPKDKRPTECLEYQCSNMIHLTATARCGGDWGSVTAEIPLSQATAETLSRNAAELWHELEGRAIVAPEASQSSWERAIQFSDGPTVYVLHGMIGSGKSTWARRFTQQHPRARIVSADAYRKMLHGTYEYHAEMDPIITESMRAAAGQLLLQKYDVVIDCGNLTHERRSAWFELCEARGCKAVAVRLPQLHRDWHLSRRRSDPHWATDWGKVYDGELAAIEPLDEAWDGIIDVMPREVSGKRILILSASPVRDKMIDRLIARKLGELGHDVEIAPCLRGGRDKVLVFKPDICIVPPIRNPNSRDFVADLKRFGCSVVVRHTEPSCSWQDWKRMSEKNRQEILGAYFYDADLELVWSADEADILSRRGPRSPRVIPVGAIGLDIYQDDKLKAEVGDYGAFCKRSLLQPGKPILLITSPWGFADSSPDLATDDMVDAVRDEEGQKQHLAMTRLVVQALRDQWNILMTIHHGVKPEPYIALAQELKVPLDRSTPMFHLLPHCQAVIHAGSTVSVSAHLLNIPTFQYGDVNAKDGGSWWGIGESAISRVAPRYETVDALVAALRECPQESNANPETIRELQEGRYGIMDGKAVDRAVRHIDRLGGKFRLRWPRSTEDYRQLTVQRSVDEFTTKAFCHVCEETFVILNDDYVKMLATRLDVPMEKIRPTHGLACPFCAARLFKLS